MVYGWSGPTSEARRSPSTSGLIDLGQIDLLVDEGFFANRTDFIRTAIRRQLESRAGAVDNTVARRDLTLGSEHYTRRDLEQVRDAGQMLELRVLGLASLADDVSPELAMATISGVHVLGAFRAPRRSRRRWPGGPHDRSRDHHGAGAAAHPGRRRL